jgi:HTH-type transcriptional regulator / antitoxin HigA
MTLTFNATKYGELLSQYQPRLIKTEDENEKALAIVEELMHRPTLSPEEHELYNLLVTLIERFEQEYYLPGSASTPHSMLLFLMEQRQVEPVDLYEVLGSEYIAAEVIADQCGISSGQARALGEFFHVDAGLFI